MDSVKQILDYREFGAVYRDSSTIEDMIFIHGFEAFMKNKLPDPSLIPETPEWFLLCCEDTLVPGYGGVGGILT